MVERQSLAARSRPWTLHSMTGAVPELRLMCDLGARPPGTQSFAERAKSDVERPHTTSTKAESCPLASEPRPSDDGGVSTATAAGMGVGRDGRPPPTWPPPLGPRPLRKKSFARVSNWLFPGSGAEQSGGLSLDFVARTPRQSQGRAATEPRGRASCDSLGSCSGWETDDEQCTVPTTWSPGSSSAARQDEAPAMERSATFGKDESRQAKAGAGG